MKNSNDMNTKNSSVQPAKSSRITILLLCFTALVAGVALLPKVSAALGTNQSKSISQGQPKSSAAPTGTKINSIIATNFDDGRVLLQWKSDYEIDNLGYNVYREVAGQRVKLNPQIIAGSALIVGQGVALKAGKDYAWADLSQRAAGTATYWLEDINLKSESRFTGPVRLKTGSGRAPNADQSLLLNNIANMQAMLTQGQGSMPVQQKASLAEPPAAATKVQLGIANDYSFKLTVKQEGWYRVPQSALIAAGLGSNIDPRNLQLFVDGAEVPMLVAGEADGAFNTADSVQFYGIGINSAVTNERVYWLVAGRTNGL